MKSKNLVFILSLAIILFACSKGPSGSSAGGIDIKFTELPPDELYEGEPFSVTILLSNYLTDNNGVNGLFCLRDTLTETYGGVPDRACIDVNLAPASVDSKGKVSPYFHEINFPRDSPIFPYRRLDQVRLENIPIIGDFRYEVETTAGAFACLKRPGSTAPYIPKECGTKQNLAVQQPDMPLKISRLTSNPSRSGDNSIRLNLEIVLAKSKDGQLVSMGNVFQSSQGAADVSLQVLANQRNAQCIGAPQGIISFRPNENEKVIKCAVSIDLSNQEQVNVPIIVKIGYGFIQSVIGTDVDLIKSEEGVLVA